MNQADQTEGLNRLREELLSGIVPLVDSGSLEPGERFDLYSRLAQSKGSLEYYQKAYQAAQDMQDDSDKLQAYLALLGDVDYEIQTEADRGAQEHPEPTSIPVQSTEA